MAKRVAKLIPRHIEGYVLRCPAAAFRHRGPSTTAREASQLSSDANGQALAYLYFEDEPQRQRAFEAEDFWSPIQWSRDQPSLDRLAVRLVLINFYGPASTRGELEEIFSCSRSCSHVRVLVNLFPPGSRQTSIRLSRYPKFCL